MSLIISGRGAVLFLSDFFYFIYFFKIKLVVAGTLSFLGETTLLTDL